MLCKKLRSLDGLGVSPSLNFEGESNFKTIPGAIVTICLYAYMLWVAIEIYLKMFNHEANTIEFYEKTVGDKEKVGLSVNLVEEHADILFGFVHEERQVMEAIDPRVGSISMN